MYVFLEVTCRLWIVWHGFRHCNSGPLQEQCMLLTVKCPVFSSTSRLSYEVHSLQMKKLKHTSDKQFYSRARALNKLHCIRKLKLRSTGQKKTKAFTFFFFLLELRIQVSTDTPTYVLLWSFYKDTSQTGQYPVVASVAVLTQRDCSKHLGWVKQLFSKEELTLGRKLEKEDE